MARTRKARWCRPEVHDALAMGPREAWLAGTVPLSSGMRPVHEGFEYANCRRCIGTLADSTTFLRPVECWVCRTPVDGATYCSSSCADADAPARAEAAREREQFKKDAAVEPAPKRRRRRNARWARIEATSRAKNLRIAHHEAGHAVADVRFEFLCGGVQMLPDEPGLLGEAYSVYGPGIDGAADHLAIVSLLAGYAAEVVCCGGTTVETEAGAASDMDRARDLLESNGDGRRFNEWLSCALGFAAVDERAIRLVASELLAVKRLSGDEVETLVEIADGEATHTDLDTLRQLVAGDVTPR